MEKRWQKYLMQPTTNSPLVVFRILFGALLVFSVCRFMAMGWIDDHFVAPLYHFTYFGFGWIRPLPPAGMYLVHIFMLLGATGIMLGSFYRISAIVHFLCFTYCGLIDVTYYLNHYYFVGLISFWMIFLPANRRLSVDVVLYPGLRVHHTPVWAIFLLKFQVAVVYIFAGLAKINHDWLIEALPLQIWLPAKDEVPYIGFLMRYGWTPYLFSWAGMLYDCTVVFFLLYRPTRPFAYAAVVLFHWITWMLFPIGIFPWVMMVSTLIFFGKNFHERIVRTCEKFFRFSALPLLPERIRMRTWVAPVLLVYMSFQLLFPLRYLLYPGNLFWTEEGYRFSWRVMLVEKAGTATFFIKDKATGRTGIVDNRAFLNRNQEKQMAFQPDLLLQYAHFLEEHYRNQGMGDLEIRAEVWVTMNARPSRLLIDSAIDLTQEQAGLLHKKWIRERE